MTWLLPTMLFVPGGSERHLTKARSLEVPALILDLEDSVAPSGKEAARSLVARFLDEPRATETVFVRVNPPGSRWHADDLKEVTRPGLSGIVLPKVERAETVRSVASVLEDLERRAGMEPGTIRLIATIETVAGLRRAAAIGAASPRVLCLGFGAVDLSADLGLPWPAEAGRVNPTLLHARAELVLASREAGLLPPHDGAYPRYQDGEGLRREAELARELGFFGKHAVHPDQVPVILEAFRPTEAEVAAARRVVRELEAREGVGAGALGIEGEMVDRAAGRRAQALLRLHEELAGGSDPPGRESAGELRTP